MGWACGLLLGGDVHGAALVFVFFGWGVGGEPDLLLFDELCGLFPYVADGFEGEFARDAVDFVVGWRFQGRRPALRGFEEFGQRLANVAVAGAVVVEVVVELVGDGGELLKEVVGVLLAARLAGVGEEVLDGLVAGVEEFDEDQDAVVGDVGGVTELLDLAFGEGGVAALRVEVRREDQQDESEREWSEHSSLIMQEDLGEELVVDVVELRERGLKGGSILAGGFMEVFGEAIGGVMHEELGVLQAFGVVGEAEMDELRVVLDLFEGGAGLVDVAVEELFAGDLGHGVDELGVEEALVAGTGLLGAEFELAEGLGVGEGFVDGGGVDGNADHEKKW